MTRAHGPPQGRRSAAVALAVVAFGLALALAGSRGDIAAAGEAAGASRTSTVTIPGFEFKPATLTVARGSKVRFSNTAGRAHTATRNGAFDTGRIKPSRSASVTFARRGTFAYHCSIHPFMKGRIVVD
jgi:plastocyanin